MAKMDEGWRRTMKRAEVAEEAKETAEAALATRRKRRMAADIEALEHELYASNAKLHPSNDRYLLTTIMFDTKRLYPNYQPPS